MSNQLKTVLFLGALTAILILFGRAIGERRDDGGAGHGCDHELRQLLFSDKIVLRMYGAQEVTPQQTPELSAMVGDLARVDS
jgi:heat shock protein HtpX